MIEYQLIVKEKMNKSRKKDSLFLIYLILKIEILKNFKYDSHHL